MIESNWKEIVEVVKSRRTQTNEPARCATLLPLLSLLPQPLALLEIGASAGLCLFPDRHGYDYGGQRIMAAPPSAPIFHCHANPQTPIPAHNVQVVWRGGLDLSPLSCASLDDTNWLRAVVWPGEARASQMEEALAVASRDPPPIVRGDLRRDLAASAIHASKNATLVVFHTAVLSYVKDMSDRRSFSETARKFGAVWVSNEPASLSDNPECLVQSWGRFLLSLNGVPVAHTDAHGTCMDWFAPAEQVRSVACPDPFDRYREWNLSGGDDQSACSGVGLSLYDLITQQ